MLTSVISPTEVLRRLKQRDLTTLLDVRSEGEFAEGSLPHSVNLPILNDNERHLVGTEYKQAGQAAAIELGHRLVGPDKERRVALWTSNLKQAPSVVTCWRGGLRSKIASQWMTEAGQPNARVEGGYKALRRELLATIESPPPLIVLGGWTGSGKTRLLQLFSGNKVDLEELARHRGSCFGERLETNGEIFRQPSQASFENSVGFALWGPSDQSVLIEDESTRIGSLNVPRTLKEKMKSAPVVFVSASSRDRATEIFEEYIKKPQAQGSSNALLRDFFVTRLKYLKRHLGGLEHSQLEKKIIEAFEVNNPEPHLSWIEHLLVQHYDKSYQFAFDRLERPVLFRGNLSECREFLEAQESLKPKMI